MKNLKVWQKLWLLGLMFMIPFALVTYKLNSSVNTLGIEFARKEIRGIEYYGPLLDLLQSLQLHRGAANTWLNGESSFKETVNSKAVELEKAIRAVDESDQQLNGVLQTTPKWNALKADCRELLSKTGSLAASESFQRHTKVIADTVAFISYVGDVSNLTLDPDLDSYYLMDALIFKGPSLAELLAEARGRISGMAARKHATAEELVKLNQLAILIEDLLGKVDVSLEKAFSQNPSLKAKLESDQQASYSGTQESVVVLRKIVSTGTTEAASSQYFASQTKVINLLYELEARVGTALTALLEARIEKLHREVYQTLGWAMLGLLVVSVIGVFIMRDITRPLSQAVGIAHQMAAGDLTVQMSFEQRRDEIGDLAQAFNQMIKTSKAMANVAESIAAGNLTVKVNPQSERDVMGTALATMVERLSALVGQVQKSGIQVNTSVTQIAATGKEQQATASEIAATTTEIGATSREISATSKELVKTMNEVTQVAEQTAGLAGSGQAGLSHMRDTMGQIMAAAGSINAKLAVLNEKAGNINQVVTTITKVADQTNLLSLNAAIEAEKAGEYGRGFAVVATEIRRLADQTAVATYDIEQMVKEMQSAVSAGVMGMDKFSEEVRRGVQEVEQASTQLGQIIQQVQTLTPRFETVNEGMRLQATGGQQINEALMQLSEAAQQTAESLQQSNLAIEQLDEAAHGLQDGVARFKLQV